MSEKPCAEPGLTPEQRADTIPWAPQSAAIRDAVVEMIRAAEADGYARGKADGADEAATAAVEVLHRLRADVPAS